MSRKPLITFVINRLPMNERGRDFVVGDLHGCRNTLEKLLNRVHFDASRDRLMSVGDLIDRGPDSMGCLDLLEEPWFFPVRGNHEEMMLDFFAQSLALGGRVAWEENHDFLLNGGAWVERELVDHRRRLGTRLIEIIGALKTLPSMLVVGAGQERYHVIHAELSRSNLACEPPVYGDADIDSGFSELGTVEREQLSESLCWARRIMHLRAVNAWSERTPHLSKTYCGHTPAPEIRRLMSHICIDTGAYIPLVSGNIVDPEEWGLTLAEPATDAVYFVRTDERETHASWRRER
ncbi:MAG: metallophosphoesterase [Gammaproteobacteria bacterium]